MSTPTSPSASPRKGKYLPCKVLMLDSQTELFKIPHKCMGQVLFDEVVRRLQLLESDYFDLEYTDHQNVWCWLDHEKPLLKQVSPHDLTFRFLVKFYTPDPGLLEDEFTRYLFALQVKRDLVSGTMPCQEHTAVLLASYIVQAELGDFIEEEYSDPSYLAGLQVLPTQNKEIDMKIMEHHREHIGQNPAEAEFNLLDTARKVELYGIRLHAAKDHENVLLHLAVAHMGVLVFQNQTKINTFSWAKIRKLSFKRKKLLIKLHPEGYSASLVRLGYYKDTVEFYFDTRNECKNFWKKCIEHHAFFRCHTVKRLPRNKTRVMSRGSSFRYSGRTQKQLVEYVRENYVKRPPFERSTSMRTVSTMRTPATTPKTGTLNSRDIHFGGHNTSASSGSHTLEMGRSNERMDHQGNQLEAAEVHRMYPQDVVTHNHSDHEQMAPPEHHRYQEQGQRYGDYSPRAQRIDPSKFMLGQLPPDRKQSMPVFPVSAQKERQYSDSSYMARSPEVENIPESVHERELRNDSFDRPSSIHRTQSAVNQALEANQANQSFQGESPRLLYSTGEESPPPPPPPIYDKETPRERARAREHSFDDNTVSVTGASKSTTSAASFTLTSSASVTSRGTEDSEDDVRRKRYPADKAYYIAKELLMTERTYKKDLEVITVWFRNAVSKDDVMPDRLMELLFGTLDPIYEFHCSFLREVEQRLAMWEGKSNAHLNGDYQRIGDIMLNNMTVLQLYSSYLSCHEEILSELEMATKHNKLFEQIYTEFETQKVCYLPFNTFLLKPAQRLLHYRLILDRLLKHYSADQADFRDCQVSLSKIHEVTLPFEDKMKYLENMQKLIELQRDLVGLDTLVQPSREFIREGCLQKLSRKGYQQRMFFLFSDMLVYTSRTATPSSQFKVHGQLPLKGMIVEETEAATNSFTIYGGNRCLLLAASSQEERDKWLEDLQTSIQAAKSKDDHEKNLYPSLKSNSSSEALEDGHDEPKSPPTPDRQMQHRANTTMHVCWHRNTSVSMRDHNTAVQNQLSGYLLRKFKNSNGWQKLWVVFTNFCLFFYKTFQDDFPLASLPLLGYSVSTPSPTDGVHKDYVFKLQFKNHVYFFRAESQYTFERWMEVTRSATDTAGRMRLFSRMESNTTGQSSEVILSTSPSISEQ